MRRLALLLSLAACVVAKPVVLEAYVEALCPDCWRWMSTELVPALLSHPEIMNIVELKLVPYGNTKVKHEQTCACAALVQQRQVSRRACLARSLRSLRLPCRSLALALLRTTFLAYSLPLGSIRKRVAMYASMVLPNVKVTFLASVC